MTRVCLATSYSGVALLKAAAGLWDPDRTILLIAFEALTPEIGTPPWQVVGFDRLAEDFDEVITLNDLIAPLHPSAWQPSMPEIPLMSRLLGHRLAHHDAICELVVDSVVERSGRTLVELIPNVPITIANPTLDVYAPVLTDASSEIGGRVRRLIHLDLLPNVQPLLRYHPGVVTAAVPIQDFQLALGTQSLSPDVDAILLGDRLAEREITSTAFERDLRVGAVRALVAGGRRRIMFVPHPDASPTDPSEFLEAANGAGASIIVAAPGAPQDIQTSADVLVVGTLSPALMCATRAATWGIESLLELDVRARSAIQLPLTAIGASLARLEPDGTLTTPGPDPSRLVEAVAYRMTPARLPEFRGRPDEWMAEHGGSPYLRIEQATGLGALTVGPAGAESARRSRARRGVAKARRWWRGRNAISR